ncbi:MAG: DUF3343 domain-containing protein [Coriobacteriia bacterium]|nr:DUF3343 domain-containing protein [Coriobacteriia bacterium]
MSARQPRLFTAYGFATTHDALAAEAAARRAEIHVTPIPAPRELGSLCGIALRFEPSDTASAEAAFAVAGLVWTARAQISDI